MQNSIKLENQVPNLVKIAKQNTNKVTEDQILLNHGLMDSLQAEIRGLMLYNMRVDHLATDKEKNTVSVSVEAKYCVDLDELKKLEKIGIKDISIHYSRSEHPKDKPLPINILTIHGDVTKLFFKFGGFQSHV